MIHCTEIPASSALEFWADIEPYVIKALAYDLTNSTSIAKLQEQISVGYARVLVCADGEQILAATVVQLFKNTNDERILHVVCTAGEGASAWLDTLVQALQDMAQAEDCAGITLTGRPGWTRKLNKYGFRMEVVTMRLNPNGRSIEKRVGESANVGLAVVR